MPDTIDAAVLRGLIERVEAATGPDRELDARIAAATGMPMLFCDFDAGSYHGDCKSPGCGKPLGLSDERRSYPNRWEDDERLPAFTASLDAITALIGRVLPGCWQRHDVWPSTERPAQASLTPLTTEGYCYGATAPTLPLALCLALLRALEARST